VVTTEQLEARRQALAQSPDLQALLAAIERRNAPLVERAPIIPAAKALLSQDGGRCPDDGHALVGDPWNPTVHRCPTCGKEWRGERHDRHWARYQHLWVAERAAELATIAALRQDDAAAARAREILTTYGERYFSYPNVDNVLGPSRLFFSTYLESLWITSYLAAAAMLRAADRLSDDAERAVTTVADEAANLIGEFDERFSNRQTWNNAALTAIAWWFGDDELAQRAISGQTGLSAHLMYGFRPDGMWYEGENYHLFAVRGLLTGIMWARGAGSHFTADRRLAERLRAALLAPALTALPDFTFPARKDSRFGVSLAQPMHLETWEVGLATITDPDAAADAQLAAWLGALYASPPVRPGVFESYLHDATTDEQPIAPSRAGLSWWALFEMLPALPASAGGWHPGSTLLADQGLAILRAGDRYASLEAGIWGGGHGHPDRLNLTLHANGVHWLPDPGTGPYVSRDLFWYRSTLAHNAPRLDGTSQSPGSAVCEMFDDREGWAWARGRFGALRRSIVSGPRYVIDVLELTGMDAQLLELPWHFSGTTEVSGGGRWIAGQLEDAFVSGVEQLERPERAAREPLVLRATEGDARLTAHLVFDGELLRAEGPGLPAPGMAARRTFYVARTRARNATFVAILEPGEGFVTQVRAAGDDIEVETGEGVHRHRAGGDGWTVETPVGRVALRGPRTPPAEFEPIIDLEPPERARGTAFRLGAAPPLDGTPAGFDETEPLRLDLEDQYRRSEEPYPGPEEFSAVALAGWDDDALYLCIDITKRDLVFRAADAAPLQLDNETDDIHSDGLQVFVGHPEGGQLAGVLAIPAPGGTLRFRPGDAADGSWQETDTGYRVTLALPWPEWLHPHSGEHVPFDLIINEMLPDRVRRAGQLAWSGGDGWVYLRGDRQEWGRLGVLELVG
jgi:hypothetical protein